MVNLSELKQLEWIGVLQIVAHERFVQVDDLGLDWQIDHDTIDVLANHLKIVAFLDFVIKLVFGVQTAFSFAQQKKRPFIVEVLLQRVSDLVVRVVGIFAFDVEKELGLWCTYMSHLRYLSIGDTFFGS
jgi:hypothetical protein